MQRWLLYLLCLLMTGCAGMVTAPQVTVETVQLVKLDSRGADLELLLQVNNPNGYDLTLLGYHYDLQVSALPMAKGGARERVEFPGDTTTPVRLPVRVEYGSLWELLKRRPDPDKIPYRLQAALEVATPLGAMLVPVEQNATFAIPQEYRPSKMLLQLQELLPSSH